MTHEDFRARREALGLSQADLAALLRVDRKTVQRWEAPRNLVYARDVPGPVAALMDALRDGWRPHSKTPESTITSTNSSGVGSRR